MSRSALFLSGGGARAAYQLGLLRCLARRLGDLPFDILTGTSAGAINIGYLASHWDGPERAVWDLSDLWAGLTFEQVFATDTLSLGKNVMRWGTRLLSGGAPGRPSVRGLLDTEPLRQLLRRMLPIDEHGTIQGIQRQIEAGRLRAVALATLSYSTGQTVTWVQGEDIEGWQRPNRKGITCRLTVEHVMASAALPILFPAVALDGAYYGDGGVRMGAPLAPAVHLGAERILAVSTRYPRSRGEADTPVIRGYPPPAQVLGTMLNALFLDSLDQDALALERINALLAAWPERSHAGLRPVDLLILRPSADLGRLAGELELKLPKPFRYLTRGLGTRETASPDVLSLLMFHPDYLQRLMELGEADAEGRLEEIQAFLTRSPQAAATAAMAGEPESETAG